MITANNDNDDPGWMPLYLSCIAGASTCLGAAVVFCHPRHPESKRRVVSPNVMCFSLALAGSVMITVSIISILPECLHDKDYDMETDGFHMMDAASWEFFHRVVAFAFGCLLYFGLSWFAFPEPDEVLGLEATASSEGAKTRITDSLIPGTSMSPSNSNIDLAAATPGRRINDTSTDEEKGSVTTIGSPSSPMRKSPMKLSVRSRKVASLSSTSDHGSFHDDASSPSVGTQGQTQASEQERITTTRNEPSLSSSFNWKQWSAGKDLDNSDQRRAWRVALLLFASLLAHNFPEGLAVAASALESTKLGLTVTIGIMIHNIPEGIAIAIPCLAARPDYPMLAFVLASLSGLAEPLGALVAMLCLRHVESSSSSSHNDDRNKEGEEELLTMENVLAFVAGIMIAVALYELYPEAKRHTPAGKKWWTSSALMSGTLSGIAIMVATELYLP